jgi:hypothetical protein
MKREPMPELRMNRDKNNEMGRSSEGISTAGAGAVRHIVYLP